MDRSEGWRWHKNKVKRGRDQCGCSRPWCCGNPRSVWGATEKELQAKRDLKEYMEDLDL